MFFLRLNTNENKAGEEESRRRAQEQGGVVVHAREVVLNIVHEAEDARMMYFLAFKENAGAVVLNDPARPL